MVIRDLTQFHENPAVVAWWVRTGGRALVWLTPAARRRGILAAAAVPIGIVLTVNAVARHKGLLFSIPDLGLALVVAAQFVLLWLVYRAAVGFAQLPAPVRRHPQLALHASYWVLLAESIVVFWNRYFYYFKELLVTFFFMPTFTGPAKRLSRWPRVRLFAAVFAAAFVGNAYYHVIEHSFELAQGQLPQILAAQASRMFYCLVLAIGIFVSMVREQQRRGAAPACGWPRRLPRIAGVWTFFGLISIWNTKGGVDFLTRIAFFRGLWGLA